MNTEIHTLEGLLAHALALENEAAERYEELAEQMEVHNNPELAELFNKMAEIERKHVDKVQTLAANVELPKLAPWDYCWQDPEAPESVPVGQGHYRMTPHQAIDLMIACEERTYTFFSDIARENHDGIVRETATKLAAEEKQHADVLRQWLTRYPKPDDAWYEDMDEPMDQE